MTANMDAGPSKAHPPQRAVGDEFRELVEYFIGELPGRISSLERAAEDGDLAAIRTVAHQLKGCSAGYGFPDLGERAASLEGCIDTAGDETDQIGAIRSELDGLVALCRSYCNQA